MISGGGGRGEVCCGARAPRKTRLEAGPFGSVHAEGGLRVCATGYGSVGYSLCHICVP